MLYVASVLVEALPSIPPLPLPLPEMVFRLPLPFGGLNLNYERISKRENIRRKREENEKKVRNKRSKMNNIRIFLTL